MTRERDIDLILDRWFADRPTEAPDRVLYEVADRIARQRQQPAWLVWRDSHVNSYLKYAAAITAVVLVAVAGIAIVGRTSDLNNVGSSSPSPTVSQATSATPTPIPSPLIFVGDDPLTLARGTYHLDDAVPGLTMTFDDGITLTRLDGQGFSWESGARGLVSTIFDPQIVSWGPACEPRAPEASGHSANELVADLTTRPGLNATQPTPIVIGGLSGEWFDLRVGNDLPASCLRENSAGNLPLLTTLHIDTGYGLRLFVLDDGHGSSVVIAFNSHGSMTTVGSIAAEAMPVIDTYEFDMTP